MTTPSEEPTKDRSNPSIAEDHDQDAEPPTADGAEPDTTQLEPDSEPASDPDPMPGEADRRG
jgi:hypothetical protein